MFQENLKNYRKAKGLTQEDLAVRLPVSYTHLTLPTTERV